MHGQYWGYHDTLPYGAVVQYIPTAPGLKYRCSLSLGSNADWPGANGQKEVRVTCGSMNTNFVFLPTTMAGNEWRDFSFDFVAGAEETKVKIEGIDAGGNYLGLDNVSVVEVPPEP